jgi:hypothetical protein
VWAQIQEGEGMTQIWKYEIKTMETTHNLPMGAKFLSLAEQKGKVCLWFLVDENNHMEQRLFALFGTEELIPSFVKMEYLGMVLVEGGRVVWHVFEVLK